MKYEIKQNHYIVAGHSFTIEADEMILNMMSEYEPFRGEGKKEDVFKMTIKTSSPNLNTKMIVDSQWELDNTSSICGHTSDGHFFFKYQWQHKPIVCLITDQQYTKGTAYLTGYEPTLAINMAMMVLYSHATAHLMTTIIHTSAIAYKQHAYLFIGLSGTGKSTHSQLWLSNINDTSLINDDKPVIRIYENGEIMLYGSPWSGKLKCYRNVSYPVGAIVKLKQAPYNKISILNKIEAYVALLHCIYGKRWDKSIADALHNIECTLVDTLPIYQLECLPDKEAALLCKETITENNLGNMRLKKGYVLRDISGDKVIVGEGLEAVDFSSLLSLNETAAWLWKKAEEMGDFTPELLSEAICKEYEVSPETAYHDTVKIINRWMEEGLIKD